ncbi:MAG: hypothetical protein KJN63_07325 [Acidimicrobiia bacterium]|nr:hypothetical protein [Acidimicrobiia bacterium]
MRHGREPKLVGALPYGLGSQLYLLGLLLMPVQLRIEEFEDVLGSRFSPGDLVLAAAVLAAPQMITFRREVMSILALAFVAVLAYGVVLAIAYEGEVTTEALVVKFVGGGVLVTWCLVTIAHVRAGLVLTIMRTWLFGLTFWAVVAFVDWKVADILPVLTHDLENRFGGAQFDQNSAGAAYGVGGIFMWRNGRQLFSAVVARSLVSAILFSALALTLSRGAFVAVAVGVAVVLAVDRVGATNWLRYFAVGCLSLLIGLASGLIDAAIDDFAGRPDNVASRQSLIEDALDSYVESNGLGIGLGSQIARQGEIVHNTAVVLLVETSIVGLVFFGALVAFPVRAALRVRRFDKELGLGLLGAHVAMIIVSMSIEALYQRHWWLLLGLHAVASFTADRPARIPQLAHAPRP